MRSMRFGPDSVFSLLTRRGLIPSARPKMSELLVPYPNDDNYSGEDYSLWKKTLSSYSARRMLIKAAESDHPISLEEIGLETTKGNDEHLRNLGHLEVIARADGKFTLIKKVSGFGQTLEWYVSELLGRDLGGSSQWAVTFEGYEHGGDFDVVASLEPVIVHVEVKSGNPSNISNDDLAQFLQRGNWLVPELSILLIDTDTDLAKYKIDKRLSKIVNWTENLPKSSSNQLDLDHPRFAVQPRYSNIGFGMVREYFSNTRRGVDQAIRACLRHHYVEVKPYAIFSGENVDYVNGWRHYS